MFVLFSLAGVASFYLNMARTKYVMEDEATHPAQPVYETPVLLHVVEGGNQDDQQLAA
jgi:hypothetical protein